MVYWIRYTEKVWKMNLELLGLKSQKMILPLAIHVKNVTTDFHKYYFTIMIFLP